MWPGVRRLGAERPDLGREEPAAAVVIVPIPAFRASRPDTAARLLRPEYRAERDRDEQRCPRRPGREQDQPVGPPLPQERHRADGGRARRAAQRADQDDRIVRRPGIWVLGRHPRIAAADLLHARQPAVPALAPGVPVLLRAAPAGPDAVRPVGQLAVVGLVRPGRHPGRVRGGQAARRRGKPAGRRAHLGHPRGPVQRRERAAGRAHLPPARPGRPEPGTGRAAQRTASRRGPGTEGLRRLHRAAGGPAQPGARLGRRTMSEIPLAAFAPVFWAHHTMIDRLWALWQLAHPGAGVGSVPLNHPLGPFPTLTVAHTLSTTALGYDYAAATSSATPA